MSPLEGIVPCFEFTGLIEDSILMYDNKSDSMILLDTEIHGLFIIQDHSVVLCSFWSLLRTGHLSPSLMSSLPHIDERADRVVEVDTIVVVPDIGAAGYVTSGGSCGYRDRLAGRQRGSGGPGSRFSLLRPLDRSHKVYRLGRGSLIVPVGETDLLSCFASQVPCQSSFPGSSLRSPLQSGAARRN